jgi:signal transduction histidine kinase
LYLFWRLGLSAGGIAYALLKKHSDWPGTWLSPNKVIVLCAAGAMVLVVALTLLATVGDPLLPGLLSDSMHWQPTIVLYCVLALLALNFAAIGLIWRTFYSVLDLWLLLILFTVTIELTMTGIVWGRFSLGWYVERTLGLFSGLLVLMLLLTETHRLYRQNMLRASARELERERQLLVRDATAASIAHELKQPLSAILMNAQVGQLKVSQNDNGILSLFDDIAEDSHRATAIIESTRSLFGKSSANKQPSDINQLVRKSLALIGRDLTDSGISVDLRLDESLPSVVVNRLQMQELFLNLFTNAVEAMREHNEKANALTITSGPGDKGLVIGIQDTGPGIADANMEKIFDAFYTTKKNGIGVGLMICHSIVAAHGGSLRVVPGYAAGAAFEIHLPYDGGLASTEVGRFSSSSPQRLGSSDQVYPAAAGS